MSAMSRPPVVGDIVYRSGSPKALGIVRERRMSHCHPEYNGDRDRLEVGYGDPDATPVCWEYLVEWKKPRQAWDPSWTAHVKVPDATDHLTPPNDGKRVWWAPHLGSWMTYNTEPRNRVTYDSEWVWCTNIALLTDLITTTRRKLRSHQASLAEARDHFESVVPT